MRTHRDCLVENGQLVCGRFRQRHLPEQLTGSSLERVERGLQGRIRSEGKIDDLRTLRERFEENGSLK